jgi:hypothetical protein
MILILNAWSLKTLWLLPFDTKGKLLGGNGTTLIGMFWKLSFIKTILFSGGIGLEESEEVTKIIILIYLFMLSM